MSSFLGRLGTMFAKLGKFQFGVARLSGPPPGVRVAPTFRMPKRLTFVAFERQAFAAPTRRAFKMPAA